MSFTGTGSFGNYDLTAQTTGAPPARPGTHELTDDGIAPAVESSPGRNEKVSRTRATSETEVTDVDAPRSEKEATPGNATDTAAEDEEDDEADAIEQERRGSLVQALARKYTAQSNADVQPGANVFTIASQDEASPLNPNGPNFNARAWAKAVVNMAAGEGHQFRTSGVAFQNLNVYGFGSPTDYQKDVVNVWLEAVGLVRRLTGHGKRRIDILRDFNGLVRKGEMLVVLGPPGSGCSTFLKTIAGDYNGIFVDENSYFNYQGE
jgi:hypothetical protein